MRVFYADTGLSHDLGHHANACRLMAGEWRARGHEVMVVASNIVTQDLQAELGARPHFRVHTYASNDDDPFCGWLTAFFNSATITREDFEALGPFEATDLLYVNSVQPAQLMALANFIGGPHGATRPRVVAELGTAPGLDFEWREDMLHFHPKDPRHDPKSVFYRFTSFLMRSTDPRLVTFHPTCSAIYGHLLRREVSTVPVPHQASAAPFSRAGHRRLTVGVLGHQRADKGYHLVPRIAEILLSAPLDIRLLLHNGAPGYMHGAQEEVRALAAREDRIILDERIADQALWSALLRDCDLVLCPYHPPSYIGAYSAVVGEALAEGIPIVVPYNTTLARTFHEYGSPGATFYDFTPEAIAAATLGVLTDFDTHAERAMAAAARWKTGMGAGRTVESILALIGDDHENDALDQQRKVA